jgi:fatty-acyl-CoA synthase
VTSRVDPPRTVADLLLQRADDDHTAIEFEGRTWTWADVVGEARRRAAMLTAARVDGPFHVGVLLDNVPEYLFMLAAAGLCGATIVGINPTRRDQHLAHDIRHTDCQLVVTDREHRPLLGGHDLGIDRSRILEIDDPAYEPALPPSTAWSPLTAPAPDDLYVLMFTSGSSGAPKAVRMTQGRATRASDSLLCTRDDVPYCAMPLFHGNALNACVLPAMRVGARIVLRRRFSASEFIDDVRTFGCTYFSAIGRVLTYILETPPRPDDADNALKLVLAPESSPADMRAFKQRFGCPVIAGYGSSENAIVLLPAPRAAAGALGIAPPGDDVVVIDPDTGEVCPRACFDEHGALLNAEAAIGELVGRNALERFEGYYNNAEAEDERRRNGWYWSGDLAYCDDDGVFWFAGRTVDWIRVDGENFATAPVERILERFPAFRSVAVYGVPDERNAEDQVMACVEVHGESFDPAAFAAFLAAQPDLGTKWAPRYVRIVDWLPVTGTNKLDKKPLRAEGWNTTDPVWWRPDRRRAEYRLLDAADRDTLDAALATNRKGLSMRARPGGRRS